MEWVIILILLLAGWIWRQSVRIGALERQIAALEAHTKTEHHEAKPTLPQTQPARASKPQPQDTREPLLLDTPLPPLYFAQREQQAAGDREPLLLDTPLPDPSNDHGNAAPSAARATDPKIVAQLASPAGPADIQRPPGFAQWLSENGLAWLGGGALALGIIFFLSFAAAQDWFTPTVQLICALLGGAALLGVSEVIRRRDNNLVAALLAGSGVLAFYATAWAAYGGYHFITWPMAAFALTICAAILLGLAFLHGEALGVLAIIAALLTPAIADARAWPDAALTLYTAGVAAAGLAVSWFRRWSWTVTVTLTGLYFWFAGAIAVDDLNRAMALVSISSLGAVGLAASPSGLLSEDAVLPWSRTVALGPTIAVCISSVLLLWVWASIALWPSGAILGPTMIGVLHVMLASYAVRLRTLSPAAFAVAVGALVGGVALYLATRVSRAPLGADAYASMLSASVAIASLALAARARGVARRWVSGAGAAGAALLTLLAATTRESWHSVAAWAPLFIGAAILFACALHAARRVAQEIPDFGVDAWTAGSAALLLIGVESAWASEVRAIGDGAAALLIATVFWWRGWRMTRFAALSAAALSVAHALSPDLIAASLAGAIPLSEALLTLSAAAAALFAASLISRKRERYGAVQEALSSAGVIVVVSAVLLALRWLASQGPGASLDTLSEESLRALTLIAAGYLVLPQPSAQAGFIARWRGHVLIGLGLLYALIQPGLYANPWWGMSPTMVVGPPILDTLLIAFAAPAALAFGAAERLYNHQDNAARIYTAAGGLLVMIWAALSLRRAFHAALMATSEVGLFEGACYGLLFITFALLVALVARLREGPQRPFTADLRRSTNALTWACLGVAVWIIVVVRHPLWGENAPSSSLSRLFAVIAQAWAATLSIGLGRALSRTRDVDPTRFAAAAAAALFAWSFGHAALHVARFDGLSAYAHALWPLSFTIGASAITTRVPGRNTVRAYLNDLEAIWATAVWPALAFAALGLWILFNPWWGLLPPHPDTPATMLLGLTSYGIAAWLSLLAPRVRATRWKVALEQAGIVSCLLHVLVAMTLLARFAYHGVAMAKASAEPLELWTYSALWAIYGGALVAAGTFARRQTLVWSGLALLAIAAGKVFVVDTAQLSGLIRAGSAIGLGIVALTVAWATQRINRGPQPK
ncbi:MAG: DUF2339 domain-containing protein [Proteobacteria bacterium]|nr:DUF2339 domain-containing protein [Pseudomonadota bacterium]